MMTIIEQVEKWYQENEQHIASLASKAEIHTNVIDPIRAAVVIEIETPTLVASIGQQQICSFSNVHNGRFHVH